MNRFNFLWTCLVWLLVSASCSHGEVPDESYEDAYLFVTAEGLGSVSSRALPEEEGTEGERTYSSLHIYYYKAAAGDLVRYQEVKGAGDLYPQAIAVPVEVQFAGPVEVYILASPGDEETLSDALTMEEIGALSIKGMRNDTTLLYTDDCFIPMAGKAATPHDFQKNKVAQVSLRRTVAKLRIRLVADAVAAGMTLHTDDAVMQLRNLRASIPYMPLAADGYTPEDIAVFNSQTFGNGADTPMRPETTGAPPTDWMHTAYVAEHVFDDTAAPDVFPANRAVLYVNIPYTQDGARYEVNYYSLPMDFSLKRNHIYQLTVKIGGLGTGASSVNATLDYVQLPWEDVWQSGGI